MPKCPMPIYPIVIITLLTLMLTLTKNACFMFKDELVKPDCAYKSPSKTKRRKLLERLHRKTNN